MQSVFRILTFLIALSTILRSAVVIHVVLPVVNTSIMANFNSNGQPKNMLDSWSPVIGEIRLDEGNSLLCIVNDSFASSTLTSGMHLVVAYENTLSFSSSSLSAATDFSGFFITNTCPYIRTTTIPARLFGTGCIFFRSSMAFLTERRMLVYTIEAINGYMNMSSFMPINIVQNCQAFNILLYFRHASHYTTF